MRNNLGRFQDGSLVATRIWASSNFANVWLSPEGHVLHVNSTTDIITIQNEAGVGVPMQVDANTQFYFRQPANAVADVGVPGRLRQRCRNHQPR